MGVVLDVRVVPRAKKTELSGTRDGAIVIRVAAPPVDGAANEAVIGFIAQRLRIPTRQVRILTGETSRRKRLEIDGLNSEEVARRLSADRA